MKLKSLFWSLLAVLAFSVFAVGCDDDDTQPAPVPDPELILDGSEVNVAAEGGEQVVTFTVKNPVEGQTITVQNDAEWLKVSVGTEYEEGSITLTAARNESAEARETTVTVMYKGAEDGKITVKQAAAEPAPDAPVLVLSGAEVNVAAEGGEQVVTFKIENPVEGQQVAVQSDAEWFKAAAETNGAEGRIVLTVDKNDAGAREAVVTVTYKGAGDGKITVKQAAAPDAPELILSVAEVNVAAEGGEQVVTFKIENPVEGQQVAVQSDAAWFKAAAETNGAEGRIVLTVDKNDAGAREAVVTVTYKGAGDGKITVKQAAAPNPPVLVFENTVVEVPAEGGEAALTFKVENPVEGRSPAVQSEAAWFKSAVEMNGAEGRIVLTVDKNDAEAREAVATVAYEDAEPVNLTVKQAAPVKGPKLEFSLSYDKDIQFLCMDLVCTTKNAETVYQMFLAAEWVDVQLASKTLEQLMDEFVQSGISPLPAEHLATINGDGFKGKPVMMWEPDLDGTLVSGIILAENAEGRTAVRADGRLGENNEPVPGEGPQISLTFTIDNENVYFTVISATKNVASGEIIINAKSDFDDYLAAVGGDMEKMVDEMKGMGQTLSPAWCEKVNSDAGLGLSLRSPEQGVVYAGLAVVSDAERHRSYVYSYADRPFGSDAPLSGKLEVDFNVDAAADSFSLNAVCTTKNALNAYVAFNTPEAVDKALAEGATLETIMDSAKEQQKVQKFPREWMKELNGAGISLTMQADPNSSMAFLLDVSNADSRIVKRSDATTTQPYTGPSYVQKITDAQFREKVWDYNTNKDFTFKGNKPCVLDFGAPAWCGPCVKLEPVMAEASAEFKDLVDFYMLDIDYEEEAYTKMMAHLNIQKRTVPLLVIVNAQGNCKVIGGYIPMAHMRREVIDVLSNLASPAPVRSFALSGKGNMNGLSVMPRIYISVSEIKAAPRSHVMKTLFSR